MGVFFLFSLFCKRGIWHEIYGEWHYRGRYNLNTWAFKSTFWALSKKLPIYFFMKFARFEKGMLWYILLKFQVREQSSFFFLKSYTTVL